MDARQWIISTVRTVARIWSLLSIAFLLLIFIGEALTGPWIWPRPSEWLGLALFPVGVTIGLVLAWWREEVGGTITTASILLFYLWSVVAGGSFPRGPYFLLVAAPGPLFLAWWWLSRPEREASAQT